MIASSGASGGGDRTNPMSSGLGGPSEGTRTTVADGLGKERKSTTAQKVRNRADSEYP
jgi:hypothetical protein